jgi:hypothetical protein
MCNQIPLGDLKHAWEMYQEVFEEVNRFAAQRHLMTWEEFVEVMQDARVRKYVAVDDMRDIVGLATMTNDLHAWPLISPEFFELAYPDEYSRNAVWYIGFVGVRQNQPAVFQRLLAEMVPSVIDSDGVGVMDFCAFNVASRQLPRATRALLARLDPTVRGQKIDSQEFWGFRFDPPTSAA